MRKWCEFGSTSTQTAKSANMILHRVFADSNQKIPWMLAGRLMQAYR